MTTLDIAIGGVLLLLVLAIVIFFWVWSQQNTKATAQRIKKYQPSLEVESSGAPPRGVAVSEGPAAEISRELADELDAKIAQLYKLLNTADEQTARLERAIAESKRIAPPLEGS